MPLLADYAITPDVFDVTSYSTAGECEARLETIREVMLADGLVRDLRDGAWRALFKEGSRWHRRGVELVKKLDRRGRLIRYPSRLPRPPGSDRDWCVEALATHALEPFTGGVIATRSVKDEFAREGLVARIDRLRSASWWTNRSPSVRPARTLADYQEHLAPILRFSNSLMFIDPHLDPGKPRYRDFTTLLRQAGQRTPVPLIEIHRVCYEGSGPGRTFPMRGDPGCFERRFRDGLGETLRAAGLSTEVFIWDDFHDRYLISNFIGISLSYGFDTSGAHNAPTTWTRLGTKDRDDVQREFDRNGRQHKLVGSFKVR